MFHLKILALIIISTNLKRRSTHRLRHLISESEQLYQLLNDSQMLESYEILGTSILFHNDVLKLPQQYITMIFCTT